MFSTVNRFQMFEPGSVNGRREALQIQTREPIKSFRITSDFTEQPRLEMTKVKIRGVLSLVKTVRFYCRSKLNL